MHGKICYFCTHCLTLVHALTLDWPCNLAGSGWCSNQLGCRPGHLGFLMPRPRLLLSQRLILPLLPSLSKEDQPPDVPVRSLPTPTPRPCLDPPAGPAVSPRTRPLATLFLRPSPAPPCRRGHPLCLHFHCFQLEIAQGNITRPVFLQKL